MPLASMNYLFLKIYIHNHLHKLPAYCEKNCQSQSNNNSDLNSDLDFSRITDRFWLIKMAMVKIRMINNQSSKNCKSKNRFSFIKKYDSVTGTLQTQQIDNLNMPHGLSKFGKTEEENFFFTFRFGFLRILTSFQSIYQCFLPDDFAYCLIDWS